MNLSKRGLGGSVGAGLFRIGRSATGRNYGSMRIPGTGLSYRKESGAKGCGTAAALFVVGIALAIGAGSIVWLAF